MAMLLLKQELLPLLLVLHNNLLDIKCLHHHRLKYVRVLQQTKQAPRVGLLQRTTDQHHYKQYKVDALI
jgi:hypothetical protein